MRMWPGWPIRSQRNHADADVLVTCVGMTRSGQVSNRRRSERLRQLRATGALTRWLRRHHLTAGMRLRTAAIGLFLVASAGAFAFVLMTQLAPDRSGTVQSPAQAQANASPQQGNATT